MPNGKKYFPSTPVCEYICSPVDTIIKDTDRVTFVPKFINSPNRDLPGLKYMKTKRLKLPERNHLPADIVLQFVPEKQ